MKTFSVAVITLIFMLFCLEVVAAETPPVETPLLKSAEPLTTDDLYEVALRHNPDYRKSIQTATLSGANLRSAWGTLLPSVNVGYRINQNNYYIPTYVNLDGTVSTLPEPSEGKNRSSSGWVSLDETLNLGGQQYFSIRNAGIENHINNLLVASSEMELNYLVRQNYYIVLLYEKLYDLAERVLEQKKEQLRLAQARFEVGSVTELDVLQAEIDVGNQENAIIEAQNNLKIAREELNRILGVDMDSEYPLVEEFNTFKPEFTLSDLTNEAILSRPDYQQYQEQERYQRNNVHIQRGQFLPDLRASLSHSRSENSGANVDFTLKPRNRNTSLSLTLSWNLFSGFSDAERYQESRVALKNSRHDRKRQEQFVEHEVRQAYYTLTQTYEQSRVTEKNRELASRQLELEQERYRLGATSQLNLRTAQVTYEQAETDHISNVFSFWSYLAALERAVGKKLL